jgi:hypothetical protein
MRSTLNRVIALILVAIPALVLATLPAYPNAISFSAIQAEFARCTATPIALNTYWKGGGCVYNIDTAPNVPTTQYAQISLSNFHSATRYPSLYATLTWTGGIWSCYCNSCGCNAVSDYNTCTGVGGTPPYTYQWVYISGHAITIYPNATTQTVRWNHSGNGTDVLAVWQCQVTDNIGTVAYVTTVGQIELISDNGL